MNPGLNTTDGRFFHIILYFLVIERYKTLTRNSLKLVKQKLCYSICH